MMSIPIFFSILGLFLIALFIINKCSNLHVSKIDKLLLSCLWTFSFLPLVLFPFDMIDSLLYPNSKSNQETVLSFSLSSGWFTWEPMC